MHRETRKVKQIKKTHIMDTMITFRNDNLNGFMTKDEIRTKAPYIFATKPTNGAVSDRYVFASTETIIDDMEKLGWGVVQCKQQRANKNSTVRSFHMVAFQNPNVYITKETGSGEEIESYPQVILTNSHDGFNSFKFMIGIFRLVCSNGMVLATEQFESISIRHINYTFEELRTTIAASIEKVEQHVAVMNRMQETVLTDEQRRDFALNALAIRTGKDVDEVKATDDEIEELLEPIRPEDEGNNLWATFNVLQEKIIKGIYHHGTTKLGKARKARPITGPAKDIEVNQSLFRQASTYLMAA